MNPLNPHFVDDGINGACNGRGEGQQVGAGGKMPRLWNGMLDAEILQPDYKEDDAERRQGVFNPCWLWEKYQ